MTEPDEKAAAGPLGEGFERKMKEIKEFWERQRADPSSRPIRSNTFFGRLLNSLRKLH